MGLRRLTGSKSALAIHCSAWLYEGARHYDESFSDSSKRDSGTRVHEALFTGSPANLESDDERAMFMHGKSALELILATYSNVQQECVYSINLQTREGAAWPLLKDRKYPEAPTHVVFSTADVVAVREGELLVADFKTGEGEGVKEQLMTLALSIVCSKQHGNAPPGKITLRAIYLKPEGFRTKDWDVTIADLFEHKDVLSNVIDDQSYRPGPHCSQLYCPHAAYCPAHREPRERLAGKEGFEWDEVPTSSEHAGKMASALKVIDRQSKYFKECLKVWHRQGNRIIDGDWELKDTDRGFRWVNNGK